MQDVGAGAGASRSGVGEDNDYSPVSATSRPLATASLSSA